MADLTTVAAVKRYMTLATTGADARIAELIPRESRLIEQYTGRTFPYVQNVNRHLDGTGSRILMLPDAPVIDVSSLSINGRVVVPAPSDQQPGFQFSDVAVFLTTDKFPMGRRNVLCSWESGYQTSELGYIPAGNVPTITPREGGTAITNVTVMDTANAAALVQVGNAPAPGQYSFSAGTYTFNSANSGMHVEMEYRFIPGPVEQACIEMVALDLKQADNIGVRSKTLANESITYEDKGFTPSIKEALGPFRKKAPV
jgi:hypothetical protein